MGQSRQTRANACFHCGAACAGTPRRRPYKPLRLQRRPVLRIPARMDALFTTAAHGARGAGGF
jgi:hypothetical protein